MADPLLGVNPGTLPPLDKHNLIGIWISTLLYGSNVVLFFLCMYSLLQKRLKGSSIWALLVTSCILFILSTINIGASLRQLIECFIDAPKSGIQGIEILYWVDLTTITQGLKSYTYILIDTVQDLVLIWRLYVVWGKNWQIAVLPLLLEMAHFGLGMYETDAVTKGIQFGRKLTLLPFILVILVNIGCTAGITFRLWYMGRRRSDIFVTSWSTVSHFSNRYLAPIFTIVESGAIFTASSIVLLAMIVNNDPRISAAVAVAVQLAATTPLLIIVRVEFGLTHTITMKKKNNTLDSSGRNSTWRAPAVNSINITRIVETDATGSQPDSSLDDGVYHLQDLKGRPIFVDSKV